MSSADAMLDSADLPVQAFRFTAGTTIVAAGRRGRILAFAFENGAAGVATTVLLKTSSLAGPTVFPMRTPGVANEVYMVTMPGAGLLFEDGLFIDNFPANYTAIYPYVVIEGKAP